MHNQLYSLLNTKLHRQCNERKEAHPLTKNMQEPPVLRPTVLCLNWRFGASLEARWEAALAYLPHVKIPLGMTYR